MRSFKFAAVLAAVFCLGLAVPVLAAPITTTWNWVGGDFNWGNALNWNNGVPNNTGTDTYTAVINDSQTIQVNGTYTIETLQNNGLGVLTIGTNQRLGLDSGASSVNNGRIDLMDTDAGASNYAYLFIYGAVGLGGTGSVEFASANQNRIYDAGSGHLTLGADQTIQTSGTAGHRGDIMVALTNNGTVRADNGTVTLSRAGTNNNLMEAVNAGLLLIDGVTLTNSSGTLTAQGGSTVRFNGATVAGGTLDGTGDFDIAGSTTLDGTGGILLDSNFLVGQNERINFLGEVTNNGRIELKDANSSTGDNAALYMVGTVALDGTGTVEFASANQNRLYAGAGGYLNLGAGQHIKTTGTGSQGEILVGLTNDGLISADDGSITLNNANKVNNNRIEAVNNGWLGISGITLTNTGAQVYADGTSTVQLNGAKVVGGTLNGPGNFDIAGTNNTLDGTGGILLDSNFQLGTSDYLYLKGDLTNNGRIELKDTDSYANNYSGLFVIGDVNLGGTGTVEFASDQQNRLYDGGSGHLNLGAGQHIKTTGAGSQGEIQVGLTNDGLISADNGAVALSSASKTNNNRIEAVNNGWLGISGITLTNTGAELYIDGSSTLQLNGATVVGGTIDGDGLVAIVGTNNTLDGTGGGLTINPVTQSGTSQYLYLKGDIVNNGRIELKDTDSYTANYSGLFMLGTVNLGGTGTVEFASANQNRLHDGGSGHLIVGANQKIKTTGEGNQGQIYVGLTNNGLVSADNGTITLTSSNKTNNNLFTAVNGGTLEFSSITATNNGQISADASSRLLFNGSTINNSGLIATTAGGPDSQLNTSRITGGTINFGGDVVIGTSASYLDSAGGSFTLGGKTALGTASYLYLTGALTNNGRIELKDTDSYTANYSGLFMLGTVNLGGTGSVEFASDNQNRLYDGGSGHLIVGAGQTIKTDGTAGSVGQLYVGLTNDGLVSADNGTITLTSSNKTNNNLFTAVNGGDLEFNGITVTNNGQISADASSRLLFNGSTINNSGLIATTAGGPESQLNTSRITGGTINFDGDVVIGTSASYLDSAGGSFTLGGKTALGAASYLYLTGALTNNGRIELKDTDSYTGNYAALYMLGTVNLGGTGTVEFASDNQNRLYDGGSGHLNLGAAQKIKTSGEGSQSEIWVGLTNDGLISADNGVITLLSSHKTNRNRIEAVNSGQVNINNITLTNIGGEVYLDGTSTGQLNGATLIGGTLSGSGTWDIVGTSTLDGTGGGVISSPLITVGTTDYLYLKGDLTNNGRIELKDTSTLTDYSALYIVGNFNLGGGGRLEFASEYQNRIYDGGSGHLIVGPGQTVTAGGGTNGVIYVRTTVNGTLQADGGSLLLPTNLTNNGLVRSAAGSTLNVNNAVGGTGGWTADGGTLNVTADVSTTGSINVINAGHLLVNGVTMTGSNLFVDAASSFSVNSGLSLTGDFGFALTDETNWVWGASSHLALNGLGIDRQSLEIGGHDYGLDEAGFSANFDLSDLVVEGGDTYTYLADLFDNGNRASPEALYVDDLDVLTGAILNLNGLHLYTRLDEQIHLVMAGEGDLFGGGLIIDEPVSAPVPLPGTIWLLAGGLVGLLGIKRRNSRPSV